LGQMFEAARLGNINIIALLAMGVLNCIIVVRCAGRAWPASNHS
jgi:hypothetical protein